MSSLFNELKRRNVVRVGIAYLVFGWLIIEVIDTIAPRLGMPEWVPTFFIVAVLVGLPIALLFSWAYEVTSEGVKKTAEVDADASITHSTGRKLDRVIIVALVLALGYFVWERQGLVEPTETTAVAPAPTAATTGLSVAVLPFTDMSPEADQGWFADGLTEEILNSLTRLPELTVTARTSSFYFKGQNLPVQEIAAKLGVAHIVEGSVRRAGNQLRITAQLIRASDGFHMWSETYDRSLEDVFAVQEDVAENVARALDIVLDEEKREKMFSSGTRSVRAYEAFLRGRVIFENTHDRAAGLTLWQANAWFEKAIAADPEYYLPHYYQSDAYTHFIIDGPDSRFLANDHEPGLTPEEAIRRLQANFERAIEHAVDATQKLLYEIEYVGLSDDWRRLPGLLARAEAMDWAAGQYLIGGGWVITILLGTGHADLVSRLSELEMKSSPLDTSGWEDATRALRYLGRFEEALAMLRDARERGLSHAFLDREELLVLLSTGDVAGLEEALVRFGPESKIFRAPFLVALGQPDEAMRLVAVNEAEERDKTFLLLTHLLLGNQDEADRLASEIDTSPLGMLRFMNLLSYANWRWPFHIEATPNLKARLLEAGITEEEIAARLHPAVKAADSP